MSEEEIVAEAQRIAALLDQMTPNERQELMEAASKNYCADCWHDLRKMTYQRCYCTCDD